MYDLVIITHLPCYYKINLYNALVDSGLSIKIIFVGFNSKDRNEDFTVSNYNFDHCFLTLDNFEKTNRFNLFRAAYKLHNELKVDYKRLIVSGWDLFVYWLAVFVFSNTKKNVLALESSYYDSVFLGVEGFVKRFFLKRISTVLASGELHIALLKELNYKGNIFKTGGVGILNYEYKISSAIAEKQKNNFLFVGRCVNVKNLDFLCKVFNLAATKTNQEISLTIVGDGPLYKDLIKYSSNAIVFTGYINNKDLPVIYKKHDIFILPSTSEPWGLVVEEALFYKLPVLISERCGSRELIVAGSNGFWFNPFNPDDLLKKIIKCTEPGVLNEIKKGASYYDQFTRNKNQINSYKQIL